MKAFPVLLLLTLELRPLDVAEVMDSNFFGAKLYQSAENVAYGEEGTAMNLPCVAEMTVLESGMTKSPTFAWVNPHTGIPVINTRTDILPGGELHFSATIVDDSGVYQCNLATEGDVQKISYKHTLIVYTIPAYQRSIEYVYSARACDNTLIARLTKEVDSIVCGEEKQKCPYQIIQIPCESYRSEVYQKIVIVIHIGSLFEPPKCGPKCAKEAYMHNLDRPDVQERLQLLQKSSEDIFPDITGFKFDSTRTTEQFIPACPDGYVIFKEIVCIPCMYGYHKDRSDNKTCKPCGMYAYQPKFGASVCIRCPNYGHSDYMTSPSIKLCNPFWKTWQGITIISVAVVVVLVSSFLILLHLGAFPCIYRTEKQRKKQEKTQEEAEMQNLMEFYDKEGDKDTEKEAEGGAEDGQTMMDRTKVGNKRWYPGLGWR